MTMIDSTADLVYRWEIQEPSGHTSLLASHADELLNTDKIVNDQWEYDV